MTLEAIPATHVAASTPSIPGRPRPAVALSDGDVSVTVTFRPCSPVGSTEVVTSPDPLDDTGLLALLDTTMTRLTVYRDAFRAALDEDTDSAPTRAPLPQPTPTYAW